MLYSNTRQRDHDLAETRILFRTGFRNTRGFRFFNFDPSLLASRSAIFHYCNIFDLSL